MAAIVRPCDGRAVSQADTLYARPGYYEMLFRERAADLPFYLRAAAAAKGPVLEVGVGTGRVAIPLARAGHGIVGLDRSARMLAGLGRSLEAEPAEVRARITLVEADARTFALHRRFELITCPFNGVAHLHGEDVAAFLARVREHLAPGGRMAFDALVPDTRLHEGASWEIPWFRDPETGEVARCTESAVFDPGRRVLTITSRIRFMESDRPPEELTLSLARRQPAEYRALLREAGFTIAAETADLGDSVAWLCFAA